MTLQGVDVSDSARSRLPQTHGTVITAAGQGPPVRAKHYAANPVRVALQNVQDGARGVQSGGECRVVPVYGVVKWGVAPAIHGRGIGSVLQQEYRGPGMPKPGGEV